MPATDSPLHELAETLGVTTRFWSSRGEQVDVPRSTLVAVLAALDVDTSSDDGVAAALADHLAAPWRRMLPHYVVAWEGTPATVAVHVRDGEPVTVRVEREDGAPAVPLVQVEHWVEPRDVDGTRVGEATFTVPADLPPGYHRLRAVSSGREASCPLIVGPRWLGMPARTGSRPVWGLSTQLYSVRSRQSWGVGDLTDLTDLCAWAAAEHGADFVLVNPLHAAAPITPVEPSPYLPTSRRFANPLYLRLERIPEYADLDEATRAEIERLAASARIETGRIDRDAAWTAKRAALEHVHAVGLTPGRALALAAYRRREGAALEDFATWCALSEVYGAERAEWPDSLQHPGSPGVARFATEHADRVRFFVWVQWLLDEQLAQTQDAAHRAGMSLGVVHDLAVGISATGADAWARQDELATGMSVGAPPDPYAQTGQDWQQPPWRPDRLAELAYAPFRDLIAAALRHSGGLRVDHIIGLFRLWWIPQGRPATEGTYVRYDHEAFVATLMIEAQRAGAVLIGEDLGTVEPWVRDYLRARGVLGTSILWFEFDWDGDRAPLPPPRWREYCLASVTTHDLPPTLGYLAGDHVRLRHRLGLLSGSLDDELAADRADQQAWLGVLRDRGLIGTDPTPEETVVALHRLLADTPSRMRCLALTDAVGERRTQNQPGTRDEYPNWQVPLGGPDGTPVLLEDVFTDPRAAELAEVMRAGTESEGQRSRVSR